MAQLPELQFAQPMTAYAQGRNQKLAEQLKGLEMKKAEKQMANLDQVSTLNELKLKEAQMKQKSDLLKNIGEGAKWADTPEKWEQALDYFESGGADVSPFRGRFDARDMAIGLADPDYAKQQKNAENLTNYIQTLPVDKREQATLSAQLDPKGFAKGVSEDLFQGRQTFPVDLVKDLPIGVQQSAKSAYITAGGGNDGLDAMYKAIDAGTEQERRKSAPTLLKQRYPEASQAELEQLQTSIDSAKTVDDGMKEADKVRKEQDRKKKAKAFQERSVKMLKRVLDHPELDDVLGTFEGGKGSEWVRFDQGESDVIADIEELVNILTADNFNLMTGVLSESDIKILASMSGGALNRKRSEKLFREDVQYMLDKMMEKDVVTVDEQAEIDRKSNSMKNKDGSFTSSGGVTFRKKGG